MTDLISEQGETPREVPSPPTASPQKKFWGKFRPKRKSVLAVWAWWQSPQGGVFSSVLGISMILCALWLLNSVMIKAKQPDITETALIVGAADQEELDPVVAIVGSREMRLSDIESYAVLAGEGFEEASLTFETAVASGLIDQAINQQLLAQAASREGLSHDPDIRERLTIATNRILAGAYLEEIAEQATGEDKISAFYKTQKQGLQFEEQVRLSAIYTQDIDTAVRLHNALSEGVSFEEMAFEFSTDETSRRRRGDIGYFPSNLLPTEFADKLKGVKKGSVPLPFETEKGWTLVKISGSRRFTPPPLKAARKDIAAFLQSRAIAAKLEGLRNEAGVEVMSPVSSAPPSSLPINDEDTPLIPSPSPRPISPTEPKTSGKLRADKPANDGPSKE